MKKKGAPAHGADEIVSPPVVFLFVGSLSCFAGLLATGPHPA